MGIITGHPEREDCRIQANHGRGRGDRKPVAASLMGFHRRFAGLPHALCNRFE
jgi:hypothetical protein